MELEPLTRIRDRWFLWLLTDELKDCKSCAPMGELYRRRIAGDEPTKAEWKKARAYAYADAYAYAYAYAYADAAAAAAAAAYAYAYTSAARSLCRERCARKLAELLGERCPKSDCLDSLILQATKRRAKAKRLVLRMTTWHTDGYCGTTHCRAGSAVWLLGAKDIEDVFGPALTGGAIYIASTGKLPDFYNMDDAAVMADIERCAKEQRK